TWFHWTGEVLAMPTFLAAPHVRHAAGRLRALRASSDVAVTIDTETFPPEVLTIRGRVEISEVEGIPPEYASPAPSYLGEEAPPSHRANLASGHSAPDPCPPSAALHCPRPPPPTARGRSRPRRPPRSRLNALAPPPSKRVLRQSRRPGTPLIRRPQRSPPLTT